MLGPDDTDLNSQTSSLTHFLLANHQTTASKTLRVLSIQNLAKTKPKRQKRSKIKNRNALQTTASLFLPFSQSSQTVIGIIKILWWLKSCSSWLAFSTPLLTYHLSQRTRYFLLSRPGRFQGPDALLKKKEKKCFIAFRSELPCVSLASRSCLFRKGWALHVEANTQFQLKREIVAVTAYLVQALQKSALLRAFYAEEFWA